MNSKKWKIQEVIFYTLFIIFIGQGILKQFELNHFLGSDEVGRGISCRIWKQSRKGEVFSQKFWNNFLTYRSFKRHFPTLSIKLESQREWSWKIPINVEQLSVLKAKIFLNRNFPASLFYHITVKSFHTSIQEKDLQMVSQSKLIQIKITIMYTILSLQKV